MVELPDDADAENDVNDAENDVCCVCLEPNDASSFTNACGHRYHVVCIHPLVTMFPTGRREQREGEDVEDASLESKFVSFRCPLCRVVNPNLFRHEKFPALLLPFDIKNFTQKQVLVSSLHIIRAINQVETSENDQWWVLVEMLVQVFSTDAGKQLLDEDESLASGLVDRLFYHIASLPARSRRMKAVAQFCLDRIQTR